MIDQRFLPNEELYPVFKTYEEVAVAIEEMVIRGAPAIGVAAAMGIALGTKNSSATTVEDLERDFNEASDRISKTRPTAVNLFWAVKRMSDVFNQAKTGGASIEALQNRLVEESVRMHAEDIESNKRMGRFGAELLPQDATVLTHCNAGALATAGYGTALGVIRAAVEAGKNVNVFADETRPFLQGARLTAWELAKDNIPVTLITDNMAGHFLKAGNISCVVVGADRIAANGDVANKIGTYGLAVLAKYHNIPFYVAAPYSTFDLSLKDGMQIEIEERKADEVRRPQGTLFAPADVPVANPAFDVTPAALITAIITERGVIHHPERGG